MMEFAMAVMIICLMCVIAWYGFNCCMSYFYYKGQNSKKIKFTDYKHLSTIAPDKWETFCLYSSRKDFGNLVRYNSTYSYFYFGVFDFFFKFIPYEKSRVKDKIKERDRKEMMDNIQCWEKDIERFKKYGG